MESEKKMLVKQDMNFLEYPLWFQDERFDENKNFLWVHNGYEYSAKYKVPTRTDGIILLYLIHVSKENNWDTRLNLTRGSILKNVGLSRSQRNYRRIEDSLERWKFVGIRFSGIFYNGEDYETLSFGIVETWNIHAGTKRLNVRFNEDWLLKIKKSFFYKSINLNELKEIKSPLSSRLYEILVKAFQNRTTWKIDSVKLAKKIPLKKRYPSQIVQKISPAINRIRNKTDLKVYLELDKKERGTIILIFKLKRDSKPDKQGKSLASSPTIQKDNPFPEVPPEIINIIPPKYFKLVKDIVLKTCKEKGVEYVRKAIEYANSMDPSNYSAYLAITLKNGYGDSFDPEAKKYIGIKKESQSCYNKYKGSCGANWETHKDNKTSVCYWCVKFDRPRNAL